MASMFHNASRKKLLAGFLICLVCVYISLNVIPKWFRGMENEVQRNLLTDLEDNFVNRPQTLADDPRLLQLIRAKFLVPPSALPYNLDPSKRHSEGQAEIVDDFLNQKRNGVFLECGAYDGEFLSNTLFLEQERGWTGLLVEPDSSNFHLLKRVNRKAFLSNSCVSIRSYPQKNNLTSDGVFGKILERDNIEENVASGLTIAEIQCFPLQSLLLAANITSVDYFSLDVEGQDLNVLKTIPWQHIDIKVISVEHRHVPEGREAVLEYMQTHGYRYHRETKSLAVGVPNDFIFVRNDLKH